MFLVDLVPGEADRTTGVWGVSSDSDTPVAPTIEAFPEDGEMVVISDEAHSLDDAWAAGGFEGGQGWTYLTNLNFWFFLDGLDEPRSHLMRS